MASGRYRRGDVVEGPDLVGGSTHRPWVCVTDETHPFHSEEALWVAVSTTPRPEAVELNQSDFETGGLPKRSFANPWTVVSMKYADISRKEGALEDPTVDEVVKRTAAYLVPSTFPNLI